MQNLAGSDYYRTIPSIAYKSFQNQNYSFDSGNGTFLITETPVFQSNNWLNIPIDSYLASPDGVLPTIQKQGAIWVQFADKPYTISGSMNKPVIRYSNLQTGSNVSVFYSQSGSRYYCSYGSTGSVAWNEMPSSIWDASGPNHSLLVTWDSILYGAYGRLDIYFNGTFQGSRFINDDGGGYNKLYLPQPSSSGGTLVGSYSETNYDAWYPLFTGFRRRVGQSFTSRGQILDSAKFYITRQGAPTGSICAKLFESSGVIGALVGSGVALAISDYVDISTISGGGVFRLVTFPFTTLYSMIDGVDYVIAIELISNNVDNSNNLHVGYDDSSPTHEGNLSYDISSVWTAAPLKDTCFYLYGLNNSSPLNIAKIALFGKYLSSPQAFNIDNAYRFRF